MDPELMAVLSMRQREMSYQHLGRHSAPPFDAMDAAGQSVGHGYGPAATTTYAYANVTSGYSTSFAQQQHQQHPRPPTHQAAASSFGVSASFLQSPVANSYGGYYDAESSGASLARACYSPLSVGQVPYNGGRYDQYGYAWHWISGMCTHFALQRQTAHYAIQYAHRILRQRAAGPRYDDDGFVTLRRYEDIYAVQKELQVLGVACVFIAAKIEEVNPPKTADIADYLTEHGAVKCSADDVVQYEAEHLLELKWNLHPTTVLSWLLFLLAGEGSDYQPVETMGDFVDPTRHPTVRKDVFAVAINYIDVALLDSQSMDFLPTQFLQLDPALLWECKNWLYAVTSGLSDLPCEGSVDSGRHAKVPEEETLFIQSRVPVPNHLAYGYLQVEASKFLGYSSDSTDNQSGNGCGSMSMNMNSPSVYGTAGYDQGSLSSAACMSPASCDSCGYYCNHDGYAGSVSVAPPVYHFKYGWQGAAEMGYTAPTVQRRLQFS
ncbi:hypothetical protein P43SY_001746 [Pythium insidiosum]|uniref:Cyclin N-terminal domain-containing protein n=1 Tax=Pythium insidiosum TaxID=114742 RepID=A0AAD5Q492_PYTIN|nr:hypothetical protein P43SY_001746 [Pythium insidiosum]